MTLWCSWKFIRKSHGSTVLPPLFSLSLLLTFPIPLPLFLSLPLTLSLFLSVTLFPSPESHLHLLLRHCFLLMQKKTRTLWDHELCLSTFPKIGDRLSQVQWTVTNLSIASIHELIRGSLDVLVQRLNLPLKLPSPVKRWQHAQITHSFFSKIPSFSHPQFLELLTDFNEAQVKLSTEMVGKATVIVMETQVGRAHLTDPELLLLEAWSRHRVPVYILKGRKTEIKGEHFLFTTKSIKIIINLAGALTSASLFRARVFSTFSSTCCASSTFPSPPSCSARASSLPISSFNSCTRSACKWNGSVRSATARPARRSEWDGSSRRTRMEQVRRMCRRNRAGGSKVRRQP